MSIDLEKNYKPRTVTAPSKIFPWLKLNAKIWYMNAPHIKKWNCAITIEGMDYQEFGETEQEAIQNMGNRILNSQYLTAMVPDDAILPDGYLDIMYRNVKRPNS